MASIIDTLKKLSVENGTRKHNDNGTEKLKSDVMLSREEAVCHNYVLSVCGTQSDPDFRIGTASADHRCTIYTAGETLSKLVTLDQCSSPIVGIKFSPTSRNILYTATNDGQITTHDLRANGKVVAEFKDVIEDGRVRPLASFDISCDERVLASGTEHVGGDAFILFWDIRYSNSKVHGKSNLLGGYWESHLKDVTCLAFHSNKPDILASGSIDGLINVFDLTQSSEDSALTYSLNTESSVDRIGWLSDDKLWCTTYTHSLQLWECDGAAPYSKFERSNLAVSQNDNPNCCYVVKFHASNVFGQPFLLAGTSNSLRCLNIVNDRLEARYNMIGNKQMVRDSWVHEKVLAKSYRIEVSYCSGSSMKVDRSEATLYLDRHLSGCLVTVGEGGYINIWRQSESTPVQETSDTRGAGKARSRHHRIKPY